jgi:hypothetical protein
MRVRWQVLVSFLQMEKHLPFGDSSEPDPLFLWEHLDLKKNKHDGLSIVLWVIPSPQNNPTMFKSILFDAA